MGDNLHETAEISELSNYTRKQRWIESFCLVTFAALSLWLFIRVLMALNMADFWVVACGLLLGLIGADFVSGFVHWLADTWGTTQWPLVGPSLIRSFREHHVDQTAITKHDFIETNGASSMVCIPVIIAAFWIPLTEDNKWTTFATTTILFFSLFILLTNQIHKWSHSRQVPKLVEWLQNAGLILSRKHHSVHHCAPYDRYYCITTGWLNPLLQYVGFFKKFEALITRATGAIPREDDQRLVNIRQGHS